jgi:hypothetical protein
VTPQERQLLELLYDATDEPALSGQFQELLIKSFGLKDETPNLPQLAQVELPLRHVAEMAGSMIGIDGQREAYIKALGLGISRLRDRLGTLNQDMLGLLLSCTRPGDLEQVDRFYQHKWLETLQPMVQELRLSRLLESGFLDEDGEGASKSFLGWIRNAFTASFEEQLETGTFLDLLDSLRSPFLDDSGDIWKGLTEEGRRRGLLALSAGLVQLLHLLRRRNCAPDLLVLRMVIHWRPWRTPAEVVAAYDFLSGMSDFHPAAVFESCLYRTLTEVGITRLRLPKELIHLGVTAGARVATTFLRDTAEEKLPALGTLLRIVDYSVRTVFHLPLLAIARAQESLLPSASSRGQPRTLKLLPFLDSRSELARKEKQSLLKDLPRLVAALGNVALDVWGDEDLSDAALLLFQGIAYEGHDWDGNDAGGFFDPLKVRRLVRARELLEQTRRRLPPLHRPQVHAALNGEIERLDQRERLIRERR